MIEEIKEETIQEDKENSTNPTDIKKEKFLEVFENKAGNITLSAKASNIDRTTFYDWIKKDHEFASKVEDLRESLIDHTESQLMTLIQERNVVAILFFLKTIGKKRGYIEKQEIDVRDVDDKPQIVKDLENAQDKAQRREIIKRFYEDIDDGSEA